MQGRMSGTHGLGRAFYWPNQAPIFKADLHGLFERGPVDLEIGSGVGWFAVQHSNLFPHHSLICIERSQVRYLKLLRRAKGQAPRALPIRADVHQWVPSNLSSSSIENIYIWYPNPYPRKQRWHRKPIFERLLWILKKGGRLTMATNIEDYAHEACHYFEKVWNLEVLKSEPLPKEQRPRTHFEKKYLERGETCWEITARKP